MYLRLISLECLYTCTTEDDGVLGVTLDKIDSMHLV